jgi:succinate-acetate transporter protein
MSVAQNVFANESPKVFFIIYHLIIWGIYPINNNKFYVCEIKVCFKLVVSIKYKFIYLIYSRLLNKYIIKLLKGRVGLTIAKACKFEASMFKHF